MAAKKKKKISLLEFKAWLEGVEEMQGNDWIPDTSQWKKIREKINCIVEEAPKPQRSGQNVPQQQQRPSAPPPPPAPVHHNDNGVIPESSLDEVIPDAQQTYTPMPSGTTIDLGSHAPIAKGQERVKTPDVDTSSGKYNSVFE